MSKNNSDNVLPHISAWTSSLPHLDRIWEISSLSYTDISFVFLLCFFLYLSMFDFYFFMLCFFTSSLTSSSLIFSFLPTHFSHLSAFFFYCLFTFDVSYVVQDHLMFLSFNVHGMLYYKVALGIKGRPNFRTCDAFWGQWSFVHLPYALKEIRKNFPRKLQGLNWANRIARINTRK